MDVVEGGFSESRYDRDGLETCYEFRKVIEEKACKRFLNFDPIWYQTQVVAGTNYRVIIRVGTERCLAATIFVPLPSEDANMCPVVQSLEMDILPNHKF
jgi:hypothetical protein